MQVDTVSLRRTDHGTQGPWSQDHAAVAAPLVRPVEPAQSYTDSWPQLVWGIGIWGCGIGAVATGAVAIVRQHERSWMVLLATAVGLLPLALLVGEIATGNF